MVAPRCKSLWWKRVRPAPTLLSPDSYDVIAHLFPSILPLVVDAEDGADEKAITAMGLLSTIETLINCMEENPKIMEQIEPITLQVVGLILTKNVMEVLESDEDELDDNGDEYLEKLEEKVNKATAAAPFTINTCIQMESQRGGGGDAVNKESVVKDTREEHGETQHFTAAVNQKKLKTEAEEIIGKFDIKLLLQRDKREGGLQHTLESIKPVKKDVGQLPTTTTCRSIIEFELPSDVPWWNNEDNNCLKQKLEDIVSYQNKFQMVSRCICRPEFESLRVAVYSTLEDMETNFITHTNREEEVGTKDNILTREVIHNIHNLHVPKKERLETINLYNAVNHMKELKNKGIKEDPLTLGLLDFEQCVLNVHKILMKDLLPLDKCGVPSTNIRFAEFEGSYHEYPKFDTVKDGEAAIQRVLDRYNDVINWIKFEEDKVLQIERLFKCAAWLLLVLVGEHPFADGNGRLCRLLCSYAISVVTPFSSPIYNIYSDTLKHDYVRAIISDRKAGSPLHLTALIIESNWCAWKNFYSEINKNEHMLMVGNWENIV